MPRYIRALTLIILALYMPVTYTKYRTEVRDFFDYLSKQVESRGLEQTVSFVKTSRNAVCRCLSGRPLVDTEGVALREGWPIWLIQFRSVSSTDEKRLLMTLLVGLRGLTFKPVLDTEPIEKPWLGSDPITDRELRHVTRRFGIRQYPLEWRRFHMSTKRGPLGQAILTAVTELALLPLQLREDIYLLGGSKLRTVMEGLYGATSSRPSIVHIWSRIFPSKTSSLRRISYFSDKERKTRVIAILDYWSQTALRPLHDRLNSILKKLKCDCTFNQNHFLSCLPSQGPYYSIDLSNATDRMPISLQKRVLAFVVTKDYVDAWARTLVGYEYTLSGLTRTVKYGAGQPMGAYSSWCAMALTHHYLVNVAALRAGYPHFKDYALLGDDLVIANAAVALEYRSLLRTLDMPVSEAKTHVSNDTYEFAKRWIHAGEEITGFAISGLKSVWKRYSLLHNFLQTQQHHGWNICRDRVPELISSIYREFGRPTQVERVIKLYMVFDSLANAKIRKDYSEIAIAISKWFPANLDAQHVEKLKCLSTLGQFSKELLTQAKRRLVERDLEKFQRDAYKVNDRLNKDLAEHFPNLSAQDYRAALREYHPLVVVLNYLIDDSMNLLLIAFGEEGEEKSNFYLEAGLSKYFVSEGVFSMRASHSINLAQSMVTKSLLEVLNDPEKSRELYLRAGV